jgi:Flp pilus assembly protein TadB
MTLIVLSGALIGLGVVVVVWQLIPHDVELASTLRRLNPDENPDLSTGHVTEADHRLRAQDWLGAWTMRRLPSLAAWFKPPKADLAILQISTTRFIGDKVLHFLVGFLLPPVAVFALGAVGIRLPFIIPAIASLGIGVAMSFIPNIEVRKNAASAREEFTRGIGAYLDLVALERKAGSGVTQSLEQAAEIGDSWVFVRLREELDRAQWKGISPWEGLNELAEEIQINELADLSSIMRLSAEEGAGAYESLRARAASLRNAQLSDEQTEANKASEAMTIPVATLSIVFLVILGAPSVLRIGSGG